MNESEIIISGVNGFVGEHLARHVKEQGYSVHGLGREPHANNKVSDLLNNYTQCDLMNSSSLTTVNFRTTKAIIHLAGLAAVGESFNKPLEYFTYNGAMTHNLLSKALEQGFDGRAVVVSTGALYNPSQEMPLVESSELSQGSPYAVGKILEENIARYYKTRRLDTVIARPFNHIGPGQQQGFLVPDLYKQILDTKETGINTISIGNLSTERDYTDVRDIVKAYLLLATAESLKYDTYNIASGGSCSGQEILNTLLSVTDTHDIQLIVDESKIRPNDASIIVGNSARLREELGWAPHISLETTIKDFVARQ
jgi:GDP-4-dehydro-6-deoxy-D-mannose reductase